MDAETRKPVRPPWVPSGVSFESLDPAFQQVISAIIGPLYDEVVLQAEDALERSTGMTLVYQTWLELRNQIDVEKELVRLGRNPEPAARESLIASHTRMVMAKLKAAGFLCRLRVIREKYRSILGAME